MSDETLTLHECFNNPLPKLSHSQNLRYTSVDSSGSATRAAMPPVALCSETIDTILSYAQDGLDETIKLDKKLCAKLIQTTIPEIANDTETDLVSASELYIMGPILEIVHRLYPGKWKKHAEKPKLEKVDNGADTLVRLDLVINTDPANCDGVERTIVVIEYKRRLQIRYEDFKNAFLEPNGDFEQHKHKARDAHGKTLLKRNAIPYVKQICKYAESTKCPYVALFNWDHLLLFEFEKAALTGSNNKTTTAGESVKLSWVSENPVSLGENVQFCHVRVALLGFVLQAFKQADI